MEYEVKKWTWFQVLELKLSLLLGWVALEVESWFSFEFLIFVVSLSLLPFKIYIYIFIFMKPKKKIILWGDLRMRMIKFKTKILL